MFQRVARRLILGKGHQRANNETEETIEDKKIQGIGMEMCLFPIWRAFISVSHI